MPLINTEFKQPGLSTEFIGLYYPATGKKPSKTDCLEHLGKVLEYCDTIGINTLYVPDATYFVHLSGKKSLEASIDGVYKCIIPNYEHITVIPGVNHNAALMAPAKKFLLERSLKILASYCAGTYVLPGTDTLRNETKVYTAQDLKRELNEYMLLPEITCDIEATSLKFYLSELLTIAFGKDKHTALSCAVHNMYHNIAERDAIHDVLRRFFKAYKGKIWFYYVLFDCNQLTYILYMKDLDDIDGMLEGLDAFKNVHDTMIFAYLANNSTQRSPLGLKDLSKEYMGEYAEDVTNAAAVPLEDLLTYNSKDCCATWYVLEKYRPKVIADDQMSVYETIFHPSIRTLLKMMIVGLPINLENVAEARTDLTKKLEEALWAVNNSHYVKRAVSVLQYYAAEKYNSTHKVKQITPDDVELEFNPNSADQLRVLIFEVMGYEPIEMTKAGKPSTKREFIEEWLTEAKADDDTDAIECLQALVDVSQISIILNTFISAFENLSIAHPSGQYYLKGNLKLGGTQSGRLSSSEPYCIGLHGSDTMSKVA